MPDNIISSIVNEQIMSQYINKNNKTDVQATDKSFKDTLNTEQLLALSMMSNTGSITGNEDNDEDKMSSDMQNQMLLTNMALLNSVKNSQANNTSANLQGVEQNCATGQDLEKLAMIVNGRSYPITTSAGGNFSMSSDYSSKPDMDKIMRAVDSASSKYGVDKNLIMAIIKQESDFDNSVTSSAGAQGLMQIMPFNFSSLGITDPYDINQNVNGGTKMISELLNKYSGDMQMALMAYNAGEGTMARRGVSSSADLYKMPAETQNYVPKVLGYYNSGF